MSDSRRHEEALDIGHRLRRARVSQRMTLDDLARQSGLTKGFLSRLERDQAAASVAALVRVCGALNLPIGDLFEESSAGEVVRAGEYPRVKFGGVNIAEYLLTPQTERRVQAILSDIAPGGGSGPEAYALPSEVEFVFVLSGALRIQVGEQTASLDAGDAMTLDPSRPHAFESGGDGAKVLWVVAPALPDTPSPRSA